VLRSTDLSARSDRWREFWVSWGRRQAFELRANENDMEMENLEKELNELTHEILYLYLIHRTYIRTQIKKYHLAKNGTYSDWTDAMVSSKCIETDLIMRLTKLDENSSGTHSIRSVWKIFDKINKNKYPHDTYLCHPRRILLTTSELRPLN